MAAVTYDPNQPLGLPETATVVIVMGPTGAGKSNFIDKFFDEKHPKRSSNGLKSHTAELVINYDRGRHPEFGHDLVVVDTPGFDDTTRSDLEILEVVAKWMKDTYKNSVNVAAILYLHRVTDNRMGGSALRNLRMFAKLTGEDAASNVLLATTMWDQAQDPATLQSREGQLVQQYWAPLIEHGAKHSRFDNTHRGAVRVMREALKGHQQTVLLLQEEMGRLSRAMQETSAGRELHSELQQLLQKQKETLLRIQAMARDNNNEEAARTLAKELETIQKQLDQTFTSVGKLKISFGRKLVLFFSAKAHSKPIIIAG